MHFQTLKNVITPNTLQIMCSEMDRAMVSIAPDLGRSPQSPEVYRYKIRGQTNTYPVGRGWAQQILDSHTDGETVSMVAYVRQIRPTALHIDHSPNMGPGHTIILPLRDCVDSDSTIVFAVNARSDRTDLTARDRLQELAQHWQKQPPMHHDQITPQDIAHCASWARNLPLLGRFYYRLGDAVLFHGHLLHCSNNWAHLSDRTHRDYLLIHSNTPGSPDYRDPSYRPDRW